MAKKYVFFHTNTTDREQCGVIGALKSLLHAFCLLSVETIIAINHRMGKGRGVDMRFFANIQKRIYSILC